METSCTGPARRIFVMEKKNTYQPQNTIAMTTTNKEIVLRISEAFNRSDLQAFLHYCAEDVQWTIVGKEVIRGREAIATFMGRMDPAYAMEIGVDNIISEGDTVACNGTMRMKQEGGTPYKGAYCDIYHFRGGLVAELISYVVDLKI